MLIVHATFPTVHVFCSFSKTSAAASLRCRLNSPAGAAAAFTPWARQQRYLTPQMFHTGSAAVVILHAPGPEGHIYCDCPSGSSGAAPCCRCVGHASASMAAVAWLVGLWRRFIYSASKRSASLVVVLFSCAII